METMVEGVFAKNTILLGIGLIVLTFAFFSSLFGAVGTIGEEWRTVTILKTNPDLYAQWIPTLLGDGIVPICGGLFLYSIGLKLKRFPFTRNESLLLLIFGGLAAAWGVLYSLGACSSYSTAIGFVNQWSVEGIIGSLQIIYWGYASVGLLWIISGVLISATGYFRRGNQGEREKDGDLPL